MRSSSATTELYADSPSTANCTGGYGLGLGHELGGFLGGAMRQRVKATLVSLSVLAGSLVLATPAKPAFAASVPPAPTIGTATRGPGSASVTFRSNGDGGLGLSSFTVACASLHGGAGASAFGTASPIVVSSLTNGKTYTCRVTATNPLGTSAPSNPSNMFVPVTTPAAPTAVSAVPGDSSATVQWTAPSKNGGAAVTAYVVTPILGGLAQPAQTFDSPATTQTVTGLTNTASY